MTSKSSNVRARGDEFTHKLQTKITLEKTCNNNPFQSDLKYFYGYEHFELANNCSFSDTIFLLVKGELPTAEESELFRRLAITFINPGLRSPAGQSALVAGVGKSDTVHLLPIALGVYGGSFEGVGDTEKIIRELRKSSRKSPENLLEAAQRGELSYIGNLYGTPDVYAEKMLKFLSDSKQEGKCLQWLLKLNTLIKGSDLGVNKAGVAAAALADLGFQPRYANPLLQIFAAPGLLAHGMEYSNKPLTSMLFESDDNYILEESS